MGLEMFIRIDTVGEWKGKEHVSSVQGIAGNCVCYEEPCICGAEESWEEGISCYRFSKEDQADSFRDLFGYWTEIASLQDAEDYKGLQITIFEGYEVGRGSDGEITATCEKTIAELDAYPVVKELLDLYFDDYYGDDEDTERFEKVANELKLF